MAIVTSAVVGTAAALTSAGMSFAQANKQKTAMRNAEADADKAMKAAREKLNVNFYDVLSIQKEPYELEREALLASGAQAIQAEEQQLPQEGFRWLNSKVKEQSERQWVKN